MRNNRWKSAQMGERMRVKERLEKTACYKDLTFRTLNGKFFNNAELFLSHTGMGIGKCILTR